MSAWRVLLVVLGSVRRNKRSFILASIGLLVGVATFVFFVALGEGIQQGVLNRIYPVNQIEVEPKTVGVVGLRERVVDPRRLGPEMVRVLERLPDVTNVYPKLRSKLQARLWGGKSLFGYDARTEAFFDGLAPELLAEELQAVEGVADKRARAELRRAEACVRDEECPLGQECAEGGRCRPIEYWQRFVDRGLVVPCEVEGATDRCPADERCLGGRCQRPCDATGGCAEGELCVAGACAAGCRADADCPTAFACVQGAEGGRCERLTCTLGNAQLQFSERVADLRGRLLGRCANAVAPGDPLCQPLPCPGETYCAARSVVNPQGWCEPPIPVVLSPFLIEVFNSSVAASLGLQPIDGTDALLGFQFRVQLGESYFTQGMPEDVQQVKRAEIVGFSNKALDFGLTLPIGYVRAFNARYRGQEAARTYDTFILETAGNEDVSGLISEVDERGFTLSRKSEDARKAADLLFILTLVFTFISLVIMAVAAVNITNTFLMMVTERRYEIGIMRAIGASRADIRRLILAEASLLGLFGGLFGVLAAWGFSRLVNAAAARMLAGIPFKPDDFFAFEWPMLLFAVLFAWIFCLIGAFLPARRAARLDPAVVLTS